jgi:hypothetical protein
VGDQATDHVPCFPEPPRFFMWVFQTCLPLAWISATEGRAFQRLIQEMTEALEETSPAKECQAQNQFHTDGRKEIPCRS